MLWPLVIYLYRRLKFLLPINTANINYNSHPRGPGTCKISRASRLVLTMFVSDKRNAKIQLRRVVNKLSVNLKQNLLYKIRPDSTAKTDVKKPGSLRGPAPNIKTDNGERQAITSIEKNQLALKTTKLQSGSDLINAEIKFEKKNVVVDVLFNHEGRDYYYGQS